MNAELCHLKAILDKAVKWEYLSKLPEFEIEREPQRLVTYVQLEHFAVIYQNCDVTEMPQRMRFEPGDWWRALLVFGYMTDGQIGETLALRREDVNLEDEMTVTRHSGNKAEHTESIQMHDTVIEHVHKIKHFRPILFSWYHCSRSLHNEFIRIQQSEDIHLDCYEAHVHTDACHAYGFYDLRWVFPA